MPKARLHDAVSILAKLRELHKTVHFEARTRRSVGTASWEHKFVFVVNLEYQSNDTNIEVIGEGDDFIDALISAWAKFEVVCLKGIGQNVLMPPVEQKALPNGAQEANDSPAF